MPILPDAAEVSILVDGEPLPEYKVEMEGERRIKCYIPSQTGKSFEIQVRDKGPQKGKNVYIAPRVTIDGTSMPGLHAKINVPRHRVMSGMKDHARSTCSPFYFSNLQLSEEENEWRGESSLVGTINVRIIWTRRTELPLTTDVRPMIKLENGAVHEKTKKLATHRVLFGDPVKVAPGLKVRSYELPEHLPLEFHFQYANKDLLAAHDIIPYSKPPQPVEKKPTKKRQRESEAVEPNDEDGLSKEEAEMLRRLHAKRDEARKKRVKMEVKPEVKPEPGLSEFKVIEGGVIDLTD